MKVTMLDIAIGVAAAILMVASIRPVCLLLVWAAGVR